MPVEILITNLNSSSKFQETILKLIDNRFTYKQKIDGFYVNLPIVQGNKSINRIMISKNFLLNVSMSNSICFINAGFT